MKLTNEQLWLIAKGLPIFQQTLMMQAAQSAEAAQRAMDVATINQQVIAAVGAIERNQSLLLAQYGNTVAGPNGGTEFSMAGVGPDKLREYEAAYENLMAATQDLGFMAIRITPSDIQNLQARPDAFAAIQPIVKLDIEEE